jgi:predicted nucleotidyltransferase
MPALEASKLNLPAHHVRHLQDLLSQYTPQAQVWAYGSRVNGDAHEGSDLDLVLRNPVDLSQDVDGWLALQEALKASSLPILVDVHLWSRLPPTFHANIEKAYVELRKG